jgi:hypothetical protein
LVVLVAGVASLRPSPPTRYPDGMLRTLALALLVVTLAACQAPYRSKYRPPTAGAAGSDVRADFWDYDPVEIAVLSVAGEGTPSFLRGVREGLYRETLANNYSALAPDFVDATTPDLKGLSGPSVLRAHVTQVERRTRGWLVSGWAALEAPSPAGGEVIYVMELTDYFVEVVGPKPTRSAQHDAGMRLGRALLSQLPRR